MSTSREKLQQARELIQQKRYDEARAILRTVNHEMALDWLDKIDKLDPPRVNQVNIKRSNKVPQILLIVVGIIIIILALGSIAVNRQGNAIATQLQDLDNKSIYCETYCKAINGGPECIDICYKGTPTP